MNYDFLYQAIIAEQRRAQKRKDLADKVEAIRRSLNPISSRLYPTMNSGPTRRKVFISYHHEDQEEVESFVDLWCEKQKVFTPYVLGLHEEEDDLINSTDPDYVAGQIRKKYIDGTSVTVVLMGKCTHSRRYVDWEIKASLTQGEDYLPSGLLGIILPSKGSSAYFPERFSKNWSKGNQGCYAKCYVAPNNADHLRRWIEEAYDARSNLAHLIENPRDRMINNQKCKVCDITH